jgi:glycosyltransferase involved in cell wall biosynthesis
MTNKKPQVSIGLPVFNGEKYLKTAIDSILAQTFTDFELIISDNASTDSTEGICRDYSNKDSRIRYYRNPKNIGGTNNINQTFRLSQGQYFQTIGHDDILAPEFIKKCVEVLDNDPAIVLCYSIIIQIDEKGNQTRILDQSKVMEENLFNRFLYLHSHQHECEVFCAMVRRDILAKTEFRYNYADGDRILICEWGLNGSFYVIPEPLFYKRIHKGSSVEAYLNPYDRVKWFNPNKSRKNSLFLIHWSRLVHLFIIFSRSKLTLNQRLFFYKWWIENYILPSPSWKLLVKELLWTARIIPFSD